jgi:hypothetical protein
MVACGLDNSANDARVTPNGMNAIPRPELLPRGWRQLACKVKILAKTQEGLAPLGIVWGLYRLFRKPRRWSAGRYRLNLPFSGFALLSACSFIASVASR